MRVLCLSLVCLACVGNTEADLDVTRRGYGKAAARAFVPGRTLPVSASTAAGPDAPSNALSQQINKLELQNDAMKVEIEHLREKLEARKQDGSFGTLFLVGLAASVGLSAAAINKLSGHNQGNVESGSSSQLATMPPRTGVCSCFPTCSGICDGKYDPLGFSVKVDSQRDAELAHGRTAMLLCSRCESPAMQFFDPKKDENKQDFEQKGLAAIVAMSVVMPANAGQFMQDSWLPSIMVPTFTLIIPLIVMSRFFLAVTDRREVDPTEFAKAQASSKTNQP